MRVRTTLVLAVLAAVLGGIYYGYEVRGEVAREAARQAERRVLNFDPSQVEELTIEKPGERIVVRREGDRWRIVAPAAADADATTVDGLLAFVRQLEKVRSLGSADADLREFGLAAPAIRLSLRLRDDQTLALLLAGPSPSASGVYAKLDGTPLVFLVPVRLAQELAKTPYLDELRDETILAVDPDRVRRIEIERADTRIVVQRIAERRWQIERPFKGPGDDGILRDLLWKIGQSHTRAVISRPGPRGRYGLDRPHARLRLTDDAGVRRTLTVARAETGAGEVYATVDGVPTVGVTDGQLLADLAIAPEVLRDRQLLVYDGRQVERITIRYPSETLVLERAGTGWRVTRPVEGEATRATAENLLEVLPNFRYTTIDPSPRRGLGYYGLDRPRFTLTVGLQGGRDLPTLTVGRREGHTHFVMVSGAAAVYTVDSRLIRVIPEDAADARRYSLPEQLKRGWEKIQREQR